MRENEERWKELCRQAAVEKDPRRLSDLVRQINNIFAETRTPPEPKPKDES
jgi:hypothetical protein